MAYIGNPAAPTLAQVSDNTITSAKIVDGAIATGDIADGAVTAAKLAAGAGLPDAIDVNASAPADSIAIDSSGRVGIGSSSPTASLDVRGTSATDLISGVFTTTSAGAADDTNTVLIGCEGNTDRGITITAKKTNSSGAHQLSFGVSDNSATPVEQVRIDKVGGFYFNSGYGSVAAAYGCRAWVNFNGTGTVAIRASGNVSSITDNGTGLYTVNFTTAMPDVNYCCVASSIGGNVASDGIMVAGTAGGSAPTTSAIQVRTSYGPNNTPGDQVVMNVAIFR